MEADVLGGDDRRPPDPGVLEGEAVLSLGEERHQHGAVVGGTQVILHQQRVEHDRHAATDTISRHAEQRPGHLSSQSSWSSSQKAWVSLITEGGSEKAEGNLISESTRSGNWSWGRRCARSRKKYCTSLSLAEAGASPRNIVIRE